MTKVSQWRIFWLNSFFKEVIQLFPAIIAFNRMYFRWMGWVGKSFWFVLSHPNKDTILLIFTWMRMASALEFYGHKYITCCSPTKFKKHWKCFVTPLVTWADLHYHHQLSPWSTLLIDPYHTSPLFIETQFSLGRPAVETISHSALLKCWNVHLIHCFASDWTVEQYKQMCNSPVVEV